MNRAVKEVNTGVLDNTEEGTWPVIKLPSERMYHLSKGLKHQDLQKSL